MNIQVTDELLFTFFRGKAGEDEKKAIEKWYAAGKGNQERYWRLHELYDAYLMQADIDLLEGYRATPAHTAGRKRLFRNVGLVVGNAAAVILFCLAGYYSINARLENRLAETMNTITVPAGKSMDYTLADGTVIKLNSGAKLQYPMAFAKDCREVHLDGEAYFDVEYDARKPFIVKTFASDIEVLGTEFNVNADEEAGTFSATLVEGSIRLSGPLVPGTEIIMAPDQTAKISAKGFSLEQKTAKSEISWTKGILDIGGLGFNELMKKLETAFGVKIVVERDFSSKDVFAKGKVRISDGIEKVLDIIGSGMEFTYERDYKTGTIYIR